MDRVKKKSCSLNCKEQGLVSQAQLTQNRHSGVLVYLSLWHFLQWCVLASVKMGKEEVEIELVLTLCQLQVDNMMIWNLYTL